MAVAQSIKDVIDKNKISSENPWLVLIDITVKDPDTQKEIEHLYLAQNNEPVTYGGQTYQPMEFDIDVKTGLDKEPEVTLNAFDPTNTIRNYMEDYGGGVDFPVTMTIVDSANLDTPADLEVPYKVTAATTDDFTVTFTLGVENALKSEFPFRRQYRDRCPWVYKSTRCGYAGTLSTCDYSKEGPNGCKLHDNVKHFGGFPGLHYMAT